MFYLRAMVPSQLSRQLQMLAQISWLRNITRLIAAITEMLQDKDNRYEANFNVLVTEYDILLCNTSLIYIDRVTSS